MNVIVINSTSKIGTKTIKNTNVFSCKTQAEDFISANAKTAKLAVCEGTLIRGETTTGTVYVVNGISKIGGKRIADCRIFTEVPHAETFINSCKELGHKVKIQVGKISE